MEEIKWFVGVIVNAGGFGVMAYVLWQLHKDALIAFREEIREERKLFREVLGELQTRREKHHQEGLGRFDALSEAIRDIRDPKERK